VPALRKINHSFCIHHFMALSSLFILLIHNDGNAQIYMDSAATVEARLENILVQMTLDEKIAQLIPQSNFNTARSIRLGIPGFYMADGPHGVREGSATSFPAGIGMAATWDTKLAERVRQAMGREFRLQAGQSLSIRKLILIK
jgi:beta-glucosidase